MQLNLHGFQGYVKKTATVVSDDPSNPRLVVEVDGTVKPLIEVRPEKIVYFQGMADNLTEKTIDIIAASKPFHILKVEDDLNKKAVYKLKTVTDGTHYRLTISNNTPQGNYRGTITLHTDYAEKPEVTIWVNGLVEGEIGIRPNVLVIGRLSHDQGVLSGRVLVVDNKKRPFKIVKCTYDEKIIQVSQTPLLGDSGFSLEVIPRMENIPSGSRLETPLTVETDSGREEKLVVQIKVINLGPAANTKN